MKKTNKAVLIAAGAIIMGSVYVPSKRIHGIAYTPAQRALPDPKFIERTYIRKTKMEQIQASETRRQEILNEICSMRTKMHEMAQLYKIPEYQIAMNEKVQEEAEKLCTDIFQKMWRISEKRLAILVAERAKELNTSPRNIKIDELAKRKGILMMSFENIT